MDLLGLAGDLLDGSHEEVRYYGDSKEAEEEDDEIKLDKTVRLIFCADGQPSK